MHTRYSDGLDTPAELIVKAVQEELGTIAVTDHDAVDALPEAQQIGRQHGIEVLTGIELTVQDGDHHDIHVLGYLFDPHHTGLRHRLSEIQERRMQRGLEILSRVNVRLTWQGRAPLERDRVLQQVQGALTRPHLAQALLDRGYVHNAEQAFQEFLIPCDVPKANLSPAAAVDLIAQAGGICSLAHPGIISSDPAVLESLIKTFKNVGLAGIEVYHHCHYPTAIEFFLSCARRHGLIATGGSDYHGHPYGAQLGHFAPRQMIPSATLDELRHRHAGHRSFI
jgi:predicted metal-dependent phosphoesterase TrpH